MSGRRIRRAATDAAVDGVRLPPTWVTGIRGDQEAGQRTPAWRRTRTTAGSARNGQRRMDGAADSGTAEIDIEAERTHLGWADRLLMWRWVSDWRAFPPPPLLTPSRWRLTCLRAGAAMVGRGVGGEGRRMCCVQGDGVDCKVGARTRCLHETTGRLLVCKMIGLVYTDWRRVCQLSYRVTAKLMLDSCT